VAAKPSILSFVRAFGAHWFNYMSGPPGVVLMVASLFISQRPFAITVFLVGIAGALIAAYSVWAAEFKRVIELEKIDRQDLEHMLGGLFVDRHTFMFGGDITHCKDYKGPVQIGRLKTGFDTVPVRAPKNSKAGIMVRFNHRRGADQYIFEYRDGHNRVVSITNPYDVQQIYLDEQSCFGLRLTLGEDFELDENSLVQVSVQTWTK
jgi:hypothetical protein